jgi:sugar-specific transcriptional regulator TrmB
MDTERLRRALEQAGLSEYQAAVYLGVLEAGTAPVVDVADRAGVPTSQVYDVVRTLEDRGFVETIERDRLHARADEPGDVLAELRSTGELLADAADEIEKRWERPDPGDHRVSVVTRQGTGVDTAREAVADAEVSVELGASPEQFAALRPQLEAAAERGVVVHVSINGTVGGSALDQESFEGSPITEVRESGSPGAFIAVVDRRQSFLSPNVHSDEEYGIQVGDDLLSFLFHWGFLTCGWVPADTVHVADDESVAYVSVEEFVRNTADLWRNGATVELSVRGRDTSTGQPVEIAGELAYIVTDGGTPPADTPTYDTLGGTVTVFVDTGDGVCAVGGWGAVGEDIEAEVVRVEGVSGARGM